MKLKLLILISLLNYFESFAQTPSELENKYWNYRDRLQKYFVQIGPEPGQSLPAASIFTHSNSSDTFKIVNGQEAVIAPNLRNPYSGKIGFGDATIDQGWYIAVLASEYWLLKHQGHDNTDRFKALCNELYFALAAVDRVDERAELLLGGSGDKNGFFIRSDHDEKYSGRINNMYWDQRLERIKSGGARGPDSFKLDISELPRGMYLVEIQSGGKRYMEKLVVNL